MSAAAIIGLILSLAPQAINLEQLIEGAVRRNKELKSKPNRTDVEDQEIEVNEALIDAIQKRIHDRAVAAAEGKGG